MGLFDDLLNKFTRKKAAASTVPTSAPVPSAATPPANLSQDFARANRDVVQAQPPAANFGPNRGATPPGDPLRVTSPQPAAPAGGGFMRGDSAAAARGYAQAQALPPVQPTAPAPAAANVRGLPEGDMASRITARTAAPTAEELAARNANAKSYMASKAVTPPPKPAVGSTAATPAAASAEGATVAAAAPKAGFMRGAGIPLVTAAAGPAIELAQTGKVSNETIATSGASGLAAALPLPPPLKLAAMVAPYTVEPAARFLGEKFGAKHEDIRSDASKAFQTARGYNTADGSGKPATGLASGGFMRSGAPVQRWRGFDKMEQTPALSKAMEQQAPAAKSLTEVAQPAVSDEERVTAEQVAADKTAAPATAQPERGYFMRPAPESQEDRAIRLTEEGRQKRLVTQATANAKGTEKRREGESFMRDRAARQDAGVARADANRNLEQDRNLALNLGALNAAGMVQGAQAKAGAENQRSQMELTKTLADANARIQEAQVNAQGEAAKARVSAAGEAFKAKLANGIPVTDASGQPVFDKLKDGKRVPRMRPMTGDEQAAAYRDFEAQAGLSGVGGGSGGPRVGATATNRQTGQRVRWDGSQWVPVSAATAGV